MRATAVTAVLTGAAAVAGTVGTEPGSRWCLGLEKPGWQPPGYAFPLVWTPLYGLIAWGTGRMVDWDSPDFGGHVTRAANGSWSTPDDEPEPDND